MLRDPIAGSRWFVPPAGIPLLFAGLSPAMAQSPSGATVLPPVTVTSGRVEQDIDETVAPVTVIDRAEIERRQARSIDDLFQDIPGTTASDGPRRDALMPTIRGLSDGRVVVRIDGARQNLNIDHRGQTFLEPTLIRNAEVLRGPASTLFGSGAIGGVASFRTLEADDLMGPGQNFGGQFSTGFQSNNRDRFGSLALGGRSGDFDGIAALTFGRSGNFRDGGGERVPFSGSRVTSGLAKFGWQPTAAQRVSLSYLGFEDDSPSLSTPDRPRGTEINRRTRQNTFSLRHRFQPMDNDWIDSAVTLYRTDINLDERERTGANRSETDLTTTGLDAFNTSYLALGPTDHLLTYGVEVYRDEQRGRQNGEPRLGFADSRQETFGVFVQDQILLTDRIDLTLGVRQDRIRQQANREGLESVTYNETSPQATLAYRIGDGVSVFASYAEAFRAPGLRDLYVGGQHFPGNQYLPNPDLRAEKARNREIGVTFLDYDLFGAGDRLRAQFSVFQNDVDDFIQQLVRGDGAPPGLQNTTRFENVAEARIRGAELELRYDHPQHRVVAAATRLRGDDARAGVPLEGIPGDELSVTYARLLPERGMEFGVRGQFVAGQDRLPPTTDPDAPQPVSGYAVADVFMTWRPFDALSVALRIDNVFDREYQRGVNLINSPGRNFRAQFTYRF